MLPFVSNVESELTKTGFGGYWVSFQNMFYLCAHSRLGENFKRTKAHWLLPKELPQKGLERLGL